MTYPLDHGAAWGWSYAAYAWPMSYVQFTPKGDPSPYRMWFLETIDGAQCYSLPSRERP